MHWVLQITKFNIWDSLSPQKVKVVAIVIYDFHTGESMVKYMAFVPCHKKLQVDTKDFWCIESRNIILFND